MLPVVPEQTHTLKELVALYSRPAFIVWISLLSFALVVVLVLSHITEWAFERRLIKLANPTTPRVSRRSSSIWGTKRKNTGPLSHSSPVPQYGAFEDSTSSNRIPPSPALVSRNTSGSIVESSHRIKVVTMTDEEVEEAVDSAESKLQLSTAAIERTRLVLGVAYGGASGTLSGLCLLFAKTGIELLILTVVGQNQVRCASSRVDRVEAVC